MAKSTTSRYEQLILEIEADPDGAPGTYVNIAGMKETNITRVANVDEDEIPDATDESQPVSIEKEVRSIDVKASGTGVWALESNKMMFDWFYSGKTLNARLRNKKVEDDGAVGDPYLESGPALLTQLDNSKTKGKKVTSEITIDFGTPTLTNKAA